MELRLSAGADGSADRRLALQQAVFTADAVFPAGCEVGAAGLRAAVRSHFKTDLLGEAEKLAAAKWMRIGSGRTRGGAGVGPAYVL